MPRMINTKCHHSQVSFKINSLEFDVDEKIAKFLIYKKKFVLSNKSIKNFYVALSPLKLFLLVKILLRTILMYNIIRVMTQKKINGLKKSLSLQKKLGGFSFVKVPKFIS